MQILPAIDLRDGKCVRLRQGDYAQETIFSDSPAEMARRWEREGASRLHLVDLDGAKAGRPVNVTALEAIRDAVSIPCQLGGGVRNAESIRQMLEEVGIERVIIGTQALKQPEWFADMAARFPQRLVLGVDARDSFVATEGWLEASKTSVFDLAAKFSPLPIAAIIYTNIANDGMMQGIDQGTLADLEKLTGYGVPVIASGGVTNVADLRALAAIHRRAPLLVGAIVGRALYEGSLTMSAALQAAKG